MRAFSRLVPAIVFAVQSHAAVSLWVESPGTMVLGQRAPTARTSVSLSGVRNEFVCFQLAVRADATMERPLAFDWTDLTTAAGGRIERRHVMLYRAADIEVQHGQLIAPEKDRARARAHGRYPDALVPLLGADGASVANSIVPEKDRTLCFWVDVFIPAGTPAGDYSGRISLREGGGEVAAATVSLRVLDIQIPADSTIPSLYNLRLHKHVQANLDNYVAEVMRHRIQPTNYHYVDYALDPARGWAVVDKLNPQGRGYVNVYYGHREQLAPERAKNLIDGLRRITAHLKQRGLLERSFLHLADEPDAKAIPAMAELARLILKEVPEWRGRIADTLNREGTELDELVTHHIRALKCYGSWYGQGERVWGGREAWEKRRAAGQQLWFYVSNAQGVPYPTFDVHTVNLAFEPRVMAWAWWYEKAYGHLYWDLMFMPQWQLNRKFPPGDGQLLYPGDFSLPGAPSWVVAKDLNGPVVSRRLKMLREGLEEWELLKLAEAKAGRQAVETIVSRVYTCMGKRTWAPDAYDPAKPMWSYDEAAWDDARQKVLEILLR